MAEEIKTFADHLAGFQRHLKLGIFTSLVIFGIGIGVVMSLPDVYKSTAMVLIEEPEIPEQLMRTTVTTYGTRQVSKMGETVMTITNLVGIIEKFDLYREERENTPVQLLAGRIRKNISIDFVQAEAMNPQGRPMPFVVAFTVAFEDESPELAQQVANELVSLFMEQNLRVRTEQTVQTSEFLDREVERRAQEVAELEGKLAEFKAENADTLPSLNTLNLQMMQRIDQQLDDVERRIQSIEETRIGVESQLVQIDPIASSRLADGSMVVSPAEQLKGLQTQLAVLEGRYSDDHPDVVRTRSDIEAIQSRFALDVNIAELEASLVAARSELALAREKYSDDHPDVLRLNRMVGELDAQHSQASTSRQEAIVEPDNPAYLQLVAQLSALDSEERAMIAEKAKLRRSLLDYEQRLLQTPQVERELNALAREVSTAQNRYWVMRDKQFSAQVGETLETESMGERFTLVESPNLPLRPSKPNRQAIIMLALLFALVAGVGVTQFADAMDKSIHSAAAIEHIQGAPPIIEVPFITNESDRQRARRLRILALAGTPAAILLVAIVVHFAVMPLDVLFYSAMQRIGL